MISAKSKARKGYRDSKRSLLSKDLITQQRDGWRSSSWEGTSDKNEGLIINGHAYGSPEAQKVMLKRKHPMLY